MVQLSTGTGGVVLVEHPVVARRLARTAPEPRLRFRAVGGVGGGELRLSGPAELVAVPEPTGGGDPLLLRRRVQLPGPGLLQAARGPEQVALTLPVPVERAIASSAPGVRVLVTAFQPFPTPASHDNVSRLALLGLDLAALGPGVELHRCLLPVEFDAAALRLRRLVRRLRPDVVLALGQGQDQLAIELLARNRTGRMLAGGEALRDNSGQRRAGQPLEPGGPAELPTRLPVAGLWQALQRAGERPVASLDAGTFICNEVFYGLMREVETLPGQGRGQVRAGFVHLPRTRGHDAATRARWGHVVTVMLQVLVRGIG